MSDEGLKVFADAFREMAEEAHRESADDTIEWLTGYVRECVERDGHPPDMLFVTVASDRAVGYRDNGLAPERILWLATCVQHMVMNPEELVEE